MLHKVVVSSRPLLILVQGTSGTGKSTLTAMLNSRLKAIDGHPAQSMNLLGTDSIRHVMRNYTTKEQEPILFASTYECGKVLRTLDPTLS